MAEWRLDQVGRALDDEGREAAGRTEPAGDAPEPRPPGKAPSRRWLRPVGLAVLVVALGTLGYAAWQAMQRNEAPLSPQDVPLIRADRSPVRIQPDQPGGLSVPHQDRLVMHDENGEGPPTAVESIRPPPEQPLAAASPEGSDEPASAGTPETGSDVQAEPSAEAPVETGMAEAPPPPPAEDGEVDDPIAALLEAEEAGRSGGDLADRQNGGQSGPEPSGEAAGPGSAVATGGAAGSPSAAVAVGAGSPEPAAQPADAPTTIRDESGAEVEALIPRREPGARPDPASAEAVSPNEAEPRSLPDVPAAAAPPEEAAPPEPATPPEEVVAAQEEAAPPGPETPSVEAPIDLAPRPDGPESGAGAGAGWRAAVVGPRMPPDAMFVDLVIALSAPGEGRMPDFAAASREAELDLQPPGEAPIADPRIAEIDLPADFDTRVPATSAAPDAAPIDAASEPDDVAADDEAVRFRPDPEGTHRVQVVAVPSEDEIVPKWEQLIREHPQLLSALERHVEAVDLGGRGIWYRVQAGPLSAARAAVLCDTLKARGTDCIVRQR